jgi:hypothetical protein
MTMKDTNDGAVYAAVMDDIVGQMKSEAIRLAVQIHLPDLLKDGPRSVTELTQATGTQKTPLYRLLYALACCGYFEEVEPEVFAQTAYSSVLRTDVARSLAGFALMHGEKWQVQPWREALWTLQTGKPAFGRLFEKDIWRYFAEDDPAAGERFNHAMRSMSRQTDPAIAHSYDFSSAQTIVDVGGGQGSLLETILQTYPTVKGILFDQPSVIAMVEQGPLADRFPDRLSLVSGNFFETVPTGGDIYLLKQIMQDWDASECVKILSQCRKAMQEGGRVLVAEEIIVPGKKIPPMAALIDLQLQFIVPSAKRSEAEHRSLFAASGLRLNRVWSTPSAYSLLEAIAV